MKWSLELSEFDIHYESRKTLKAHVFADFLAEMTFSMEDNTEEWIVFVDGSSNSKGSGAGIIIENNKGIVVEISLGLSFPVTNNTAEYEAFLVGLRTAQDLGDKKVKIFTDSQSVASQVTGEFQVKEETKLSHKKSSTNQAFRDKRLSSTKSTQLLGWRIGEDPFLVT